MLELGLPGGRLLRQVEGPYLLAQDFRVEERRKAAQNPWLPASVYPAHT